MKNDNKLQRIPARWAVAALCAGPLWVAAQSADAPADNPPAAAPRVSAPAGLPAPAASTPSPALRTPRLSSLPELLGVPNLLPLEPAAGAPGGAQPMTLTNAVRRGLDNSLDVEAARYRFESFNQTRRAARGALFPKLDLRAGSGVGRLESAESPQTLERVDTALTLKQPLWDTPARKEWQRQKVLTGSVAIQLDGTRSAAALEVSAAYLQVLQTRLSTELSQDYEKLLEELLRYIDARTAAGAASPADQDRVKARVANARAGIADSKASGKVALLNLRRLVGEEANAMMFVLPSGLQIPADPLAAKDVARTRNHDLLAFAEETKAIQLEYEGQRGRFEPRAEIEVSASKSRNISGSVAVSRDAKVMLMVTVPLLNGGVDVAQMRATTARLREQQARAANVERKLAQELDAAYANLDSFDTRYVAAREELSANAAVVKAFREQLTGANRTLLDVLDAYQRFHQSKLDLLQLAVGETQTQLRVAHLTGGLLDGLSSPEPGSR